ncbi:hypothetical protein C5167_043967 [Papaver somniferum]|uniref:Uncharacterized protein n=1 Tax=Papaver somniferum TaxID=3469 RepID=A0A4Y7L862_PAPSO|nr:hypothetical protein C5167_043967 [Papaver somniferum]
MKMVLLVLGFSLAEITRKKNYKVDCEEDVDSGNGCTAGSVNLRTQTEWAVSCKMQEMVVVGLELLVSVTKLTSISSNGPSDWASLMGRMEEESGRVGRD